MAFFIIFVGKIFFLQNIYGFTPVKKILSHLDQKWAQTKQLLSKKFQLPIAMEGCIVHWREIIQMQPMQLFIHSFWSLERPQNDTHWRKAIQMHPVRLLIDYIQWNEKAPNGPLQRETLQVQTVQVFSPKCCSSQAPCNDAHWGKETQMLSVQLFINHLEWYE